MYIAFVVTCKGRLHHLKETLPLIVKQEPDEIVVVDYGCPDGTAAWVAVNFPRVKIVQFDSPSFNVSHARNLGAQAVQSMWLCFIDADIRIAPGWLEWLRKNMRPNTFYRSDNFKCDRDTTGTMVCPRSNFESVGGYDEAFSAWGGEDADMYLRLRQAGVIRCYFPGSFVSAIAHGNDLRVAFFEQKSIKNQSTINSCYKRIKSFIRCHCGAELPLDVRQSIYNQILSQANVTDKTLSTRIVITLSMQGLSSRGMSSEYVFTQRRKYLLFGKRTWVMPPPPPPR